MPIDNSLLLIPRYILPICVYLDSEYGKKDIYLGVPIKLERHDVEEVIELKRTADEKKPLIDPRRLLD